MGEMRARVAIVIAGSVLGSDKRSVLREGAMCWSATSVIRVAIVIAASVVVENLC